MGPGTPPVRQQPLHEGAGTSSFPREVFPRPSALSLGDSVHTVRHTGSPGTWPLAGNPTRSPTPRQPGPCNQQLAPGPGGRGGLARGPVQSREPLPSGSPAPTLPQHNPREPELATGWTRTEACAGCSRGHRSPTSPPEPGRPAHAFRGPPTPIVPGRDPSWYSHVTPFTLEAQAALAVACTPATRHQHHPTAWIGPQWLRGPHSHQASWRSLSFASPGIGLPQRGASAPGSPSAKAVLPTALQPHTRPRDPPVAVPSSPLHCPLLLGASA